MNKRLFPVEKMLLLCISFTMLLLLARISYTKELTYGFYIWNTFLAILPLAFSRQLSERVKPGLKSYTLIALWLLFFPNAPYILTDIFHYSPKPPVPYWFDLLLVSTAAWNGLLLGIVSLMHVEQYLSVYMKAKWVRSAVIVSMILCGYGVYIGRFLRFNSWDIITDPFLLVRTSAYHFLQPFNNIRLWSFTFLFASMYTIIYLTIRQIHVRPDKH